MSETTIGLNRKISSASDLQSVVRTMKALAASSIAQYENSVRALSEYSHSVELGLSVCLRCPETAAMLMPEQRSADTIGAVVFGSDQGLVGQFNEVVSDFASCTLSAVSSPAKVWAVGERVQSQLLDAGLNVIGLFTMPNSVKLITPLVGQILIACEAHRSRGEIFDLRLFYNRPTSGTGYAPFQQRLLPLDDEWQRQMAEFPWPTRNLPEPLGSRPETLRALIREYLFVSLFQACAESLASENASRLAAMERADKNIEDLLDNLNGSFHRLRQSRIDEELFDVVAGFRDVKPG